MSVHLYFLGSVVTANEVSLHPPHLIDTSGSLTPAALIPFCAYQTNTNLMGQTRQGLPFTACSQFKPTILEGKMCYSVNLTSLDTEKTKPGKWAGLVFLLDIGMQITGETQHYETSENPFAMASSQYDARSARIYLNTLSSFTDYRAGSYALTALKKITGTHRFLKQIDDEKECNIETLEDCQAKHYIYRVQEKCGCVPWALSSALVIKVLQAKLLLFLQFPSQDVQFCSPNVSACYKKVQDKPSNCGVSCTGLYADVEFTKDTILDSDQERERQNLLPLLNNYTEYKRSFVKQMKFDPQSDNSSK